MNFINLFFNPLNSSKLLEFKNNTKKLWGVMKELISKIPNTESRKLLK